MMSHRWMIEAMEMVGTTHNVVTVFENSKETWKTVLVACSESLVEVVVRRRIFHGDSFSPLFFVVVLIPSLGILNETDLGYVTSRNQKLDNLKVYAKNQ